MKFIGSTARNSVDFSTFTRIGDTYGETYIPEAERQQEFLEDEFDRLDNHKPRINIYQVRRRNVLNNIRRLRDGRRLLIDAFRNKIYPLRDPAFYPQYRDSESDDENNGNNGNNGNNTSSESDDSDENGTQSIINNSNKFYSSLVYKYFRENSLTDINKKLIKYKKIPKYLKFLEEFGRRLIIGLKKLKKDKKDLP